MLGFMHDPGPPFVQKKSVRMFNRTLFEKSSAFLGGPVIRALFWGDMFF